MSNKHTRIYKGKIFTKKGLESGDKKIITFDLDETLGAFGEMYILWQLLGPTPINSSSIFRELMKIYPEFLRPGIIPILEYLEYKKRIGQCSHIFLYTNNQCSPIWIDLILKYFDEELETINLFDKAVKAFKINNEIIEPLRTSHQKIYSDLIRCTMIPKQSELCFIDNTYHKKMEHDRVYYIQPKSYEHGLSAEEIVDRVVKKWTITQFPPGFEKGLREMFSTYVKKSKYSGDEAIIVSQKIMYHLKEYFLLSTKKPKTKKISFGLGRFTRKR